MTPAEFRDHLVPRWQSALKEYLAIPSAQRSRSPIKNKLFRLTGQIATASLELDLVTSRNALASLDLHMDRLTPEHAEAAQAVVASFLLELFPDRLETVRQRVKQLIHDEPHLRSEKSQAVMTALRNRGGGVSRQLLLFVLRELANEGFYSPK